jgi:hypothetical protein
MENRHVLVDSNTMVGCYTRCQSIYGVDDSGVSETECAVRMGTLQSAYCDTRGWLERAMLYLDLCICLQVYLPQNC